MISFKKEYWDDDILDRHKLDCLTHQTCDLDYGLYWV
jgi:hypothetical protein